MQNYQSNSPVNVPSSGPQKLIPLIVGIIVVGGIAYQSSDVITEVKKVIKEQANDNSCQKNLLDRNNEYTELKKKHDNVLEERNVCRKDNDFASKKVVNNTEFVKYSDNELFEFVYPKEWTFIAKQADSIAFNLKTGRESVVIDFQSTETKDIYDVVSAVEKSTPNKFYKQKRTVNGVDAFGVLEVPADGYAVYYVSFITDGYLFSFNIINHNEQNQPFLDDYERMVSSFKLK